MHEHGQSDQCVYIAVIVCIKYPVSEGAKADSQNMLQLLAPVKFF